MHELSVVDALITEVLKRLEGHDVIKVNYVTLQIGELSFLSEESMRFAYETLAEETLLAGSELRIETVPATVECGRCGFRGEIPKDDIDPTVHFFIPKFVCPKCGSDVKLLTGKETILSHISGEVRDGEGATG